MLEWNETSHTEMDIKYGGALGNLPIEMSAQNKEFRVRIEEFFNQWVSSVADILTEMVKNHQLDELVDPKKDAESIVAMIEGGILLMVSRQNIQVLEDIFAVIKQQYHLNE